MIGTPTPTPTPSPIFAVLDRPCPLACCGVAVEVELGLIVDENDEDECKDDDGDSEEGVAMDVIVELLEMTGVRGVGELANGIPVPVSVSAVVYSCAVAVMGPLMTGPWVDDVWPSVAVSPPCIGGDGTIVPVGFGMVVSDKRKAR